MTDIAAQHAEPRIERIRHELKRRDLIVARTERLTPHMQRITLTGAELEGFYSAAPDDHVKIMLLGEGEPQRRDYTPRRHDAAKGELVIDFALHEAGPATDWALSAVEGSGLTIGGPRGSQVIAGDIDRWLLIGDETALPAIGRRIEEMAAGTPVAALIAVPGPEDEQSFDTAATTDIRWIHRPEAEAVLAERLLAPLREMELGPRCFVWIAAEASVTRALRAYLLEERGLPKHWVKASGYWVAGAADAVEHFD
ncbi:MULTISPECIES: siderophore-interacting protein [unclassified Haematobacter]|uniref:siderophore-interacting protein n=1 Tax=unclassified Haematobacter TaxID=2640585 RepID=UPI0025C15EEC|nr:MULTISPECIES: siderophore-interacting protein [unclassified Haematobacter]